VGRPLGSKNPEYERRRRRLLDAAMPRLIADHGTTSLNELAAEVGVSVPTLRHYFGDRAGMVAAALRRQKRRARPHLEQIAVPASPDLAASLAGFLHELAGAWRAFGVGPLFAAGLAMGLQETAAGPAYLDGVLEPTLAAVEARLRAHAGAGALRVAADDADGLRAAALALLSPVVLALLHQDALGGAACRALDVPAFVRAHVDGFVRGWGRPPAAAS
jgi:AcrR family transcriptional regulator